MRMYTTYTEEIDDPQAAVQDILSQLPGNIDELAKSKNLVGIVATHVDAIHEGVVEALSKALPFELVGMTTFASATQKACDWDMLTLVVMESEAVRFATVVSEILVNDCQASVAAAYTKAKTALGEEASLIIAYAPFLKDIGGQDIVNVLTRASNNAPLLGALASDHTRDATESFVIHNGTAYPANIALLCMAGPINAQFYFASLQEAGVKNKQATITSCDGCVVSEVNNVPVMDFLSTLGFTAETWEETSLAIPFVVDYKDGTPPLARELLRVTSEGHMVFGGDMPLGAYINLALQTTEEILRSTETVLRRIAQERPPHSAILMVGCVGRAMVLGSSPLSEARMLTEILGDDVTMHLVYARGEICPAYATHLSETEQTTKRRNSFHNFSFTACVFFE